MALRLQSRYIADAKHLGCYGKAYEQGSRYVQPLHCCQHAFVNHWAAYCEMHVRPGDLRRSHLHATALEPLHKLQHFGVTSDCLLESRAYYVQNHSNIVFTGCYKLIICGQQS